MRAKGTDRSKRVYKNAGHDAKKVAMAKRPTPKVRNKTEGKNAAKSVGAAPRGLAKGKAKVGGAGKVTPNRGMSSKVSDFKASGLSGKAFGEAVSMAAKNRGPASAATATKAKAQKSAGAKPATAVKGGTARKMAPTAVAKGKGRGRVKK